MTEINATAVTVTSVALFIHSYSISYGINNNLPNIFSNIFLQSAQMSRGNVKERGDILGAEERNKCSSYFVKFGILIGMC